MERLPKFFRKVVTFLLVVTMATLAGYHLGSKVVKQTVVMKYGLRDSALVEENLDKPKHGQVTVARESLVSKYNTSHVDILGDGVFNVVHYLWCEVKVFEFQHYLSVRSVIQYINPERIVFHYADYPRHDNYMYNSWFEDMKKEYPFIYLDSIDSDQSVCTSNQTKMKYIDYILRQEGGIYVHYNTIFRDFPASLRKPDIVDGLSTDLEGFLLIKTGSLREDGDSQKISESVFKCLDANNFISDYDNSICFIKKGPYYPRDCWNRYDPVSKHVNYLLYGQQETPKPKPSNTELIPNIAHMLWLGGNEMDFLFYLSCLSQIYILKVDVLYVHGDQEPKGEYWLEIKKEPKVQFVKRTWPNRVYRQEIKVWNHMSDVFRVDVMLRHGGIYTDTDALWVKPIPQHLRLYDAVATYDWPEMYNTYPDYINFGAALGKKNGKYWRLVMESFKDFKDEFYGYNGLLRPHRIYEFNPDLLYVYNRLQVMCWNLKCHPTWVANFRDSDASHLTMDHFDWREAHVFHWTDPTPKEFSDENTLKNSTGIFAEIGQHVLKAAGRL